ncbi:MAG: hypothetical protein QOH62_1058 [Solirubrobacteraceae bacterium]|jgi:hypothetical protein|nr:hypothetical protein [Solirubrobacteraceae bacterium]
MQGITSARSTGAVLGFGALAGCFALSAPALANVPTTITHSEITSPTGPFYSVFNTDSGSTNEQFTFSGTSDGDASTTVDIRCYDTPNSYSDIASGVPVAADGTFTSSSVDLSSAYDEGCRLRAIPSSTSPTDLSPFDGPWMGSSYTNTSAIGGGPNDGAQNDFFADLWQRAGHVEYSSVSDCAIEDMYVYSPLSRQSDGESWTCSAVLGTNDPVANVGRSQVEVDGRQAYGSYAATQLFTGGPNSADNTGFEPLTSSISQSATTGEGSITEDQSFVACPDGPGNYPADSTNCASFIPTGVKLSRTITQGDDGRTVLIADAWSSTDAAAHQLKLHYDNGIQSYNHCCSATSVAWAWPGQEPTTFQDGDIVASPSSGPGSVTGRQESLLAASTSWPAFALTWDTAPVRARYYNGGSGCCPPPASNRFLLDYSVDVPASGKTVLRFSYADSATTAGAEALATRTRDSFAAPTVTLTAPADGSTVNTSTVNVQGKALDNVGIASLVVNGTPVTPAADGTFSVPVSLAAGANALTATVKDAAGNSAEAKETVTYAAPSTTTTTPPPPPAAVKCVVPSVKKGSTVSTVKKLLTKANCKAGRLVQKRSAKTKKGRVLGMINSPGIRFPKGQKLQIIVSSGPKKKK